MTLNERDKNLGVSISTIIPHRFDLKFQNLHEKLQKKIFFYFLMLTCHSRRRVTKKKFFAIFFYSPGVPKFCLKMEKINYLKFFEGDEEKYEFFCFFTRKKNWIYSIFFIFKRDFGTPKRKKNRNFFSGLMRPNYIRHVRTKKLKKKNIFFAFFMQILKF